MLIKWSKSQFLFEIVEKIFSVKCKQTEHVDLLLIDIFGKSRDLQNEIIREARWPTKKAGFVTIGDNCYDNELEMNINR
jgi:hypothetical protein